jgi:hypothetical protein
LGKDMDGAEVSVPFAILLTPPTVLW